MKPQTTASMGFTKRKPRWYQTMGRVKQFVIAAVGVIIGIITLKRLRQRRKEPKKEAKQAAKEALDEAAKAAEHSAASVEHARLAGQKTVEAASDELGERSKDEETTGRIGKLKKRVR